MKSVAIIAMGTSNQVWLRRSYRGDSPDFFAKVFVERFGQCVKDVGVSPQEVSVLKGISQTLAKRKMIQEVGPPFDQVWGINHIGKVLRKSEKPGDGGLSLIIAMDDLRHEKERYGEMLTGDIPIMTSKAYPEFPKSIEYPIRDIVKFLHKPVAEHAADKIITMLEASKSRVSKQTIQSIRDWAHNSSTISFMGDYIRNSVTAAVILAAYTGFDRIALYGADFYYDEDNGRSEQARANCEFWMGFCHALGIKLEVATGSTTLDMNKNRGLYGYAEQPPLPFNDTQDFIPDGRGYKLVSNEGKGQKAPAVHKDPV